MMESIAQQAAKDARDVFSDDRQAQAAIGYMEQLIYAALRNVEYDFADPVTVHVNMLRGTIAKPTVEQIVHLYGVDTLAKALAPVIVREAAPYMTDLMVDPETILDMEMEYDHRAGDDSDD